MIAKSVLSSCGSLFMFSFSVHTTVVRWFLSQTNVNINKLPCSKGLYFCMKCLFVYINFQIIFSHLCHWIISEIFIFLTNKWHTTFKGHSTWICYVPKMVDNTMLHISIFDCKYILKINRVKYTLIHLQILHCNIRDQHLCYL